MKIIKLRTLHGPNVYAHFPVIKMTLDLEELADVRSAELPSFNDRLLTSLTGLRTHRCSIGRPGGFVTRLERGTYMGHVVEHVALELSAPAGIRVGYGTTRRTPDAGVYDVVVAFRDEEAMMVLLRASVAMCESLARGHAYDPAGHVMRARRIADARRFGPSTQALVDSAEKRRIPWTRLDDRSLLALGTGVHRKLIRATTSSTTGFIATQLAGDKQLCKVLLERSGIRTPKSVLVRNADEAVEAASSLNGAVVVKPLDGNHGRGVTLDLSEENEIRAAYAVARGVRPQVIVEELVHGTNYRVVVVGGRMVAAAERLPPRVVGDGSATVRALVARENRNPLRGVGHSRILSKITIDDIVLAHLAKRGISLEKVLAKDEVVTLRESANLSTGGTAHDVTDSVHPSFARMCERAARAIDLDICGIDLVCTDIAEPADERRGANIEMNAAPGIRMHHHPSRGRPRDVAGAIVDTIFAPGTASRVPILSVTGTNGKTTTTRLIAHIMAHHGLVVGTTNTDGVYVDGVAVRRGDTTGPSSARMVLFDPTVEVAVLETARGGILRRGLGYDAADVAVITNVTADHLGQDGVETIDDLVHVKAVVAERVVAGGTVVLNAEDPKLVALSAHPRVARPGVAIVLFATDPHNRALSGHVARGGTGYVIERGAVIEVKRDGTRSMALLDEVPITFGGMARCATANVLAAIAAARALGVPGAVISSALSSFGDAENPGRMNVFRVNGGRAVIDYGHNPAALLAAREIADVFRPATRAAVISVPGDRGDEAIRASGAALARTFERVIIKEDRNRRGRAEGEIASLLAAAIRATNADVNCVIELDERRAIGLALDTMPDNEVAVIFTDVPQVALEEITRRGGYADPSRTSARSSAIDGLRVEPPARLDRVG